MKSNSKINFAQEYLYSIHQVYVLIQKHMEKKLSKNSILSFSQFWVLVCFIECQNESIQTASQVAKKMYMSEATISGHVDRLSKLKLIFKKQDPKNRRKSIIQLTDKGKIVFSKTKKIIEQELDKIFNTVKVDDRGKIINAFEEVIKKIIEIKN